MTANRVDRAPAPRLVTDAPLAHLAWGPMAQPTVPLAVLLHGVGGGREGWASTGAALAARGWRVLAADQPGYGLSRSITPYTLAGMAGAVAQLIQWAGAQPVLVVGHSMGGMVAQELWATAPQCVAGLVLAGTSPAFGKADGDWQRSFLQARFAPLDAGLGMAGLAQKLVPSMLGSAALAHSGALSQAIMSQVPEATYRAAVHALLPFDRRAELPSVAVPTLVITGEDDSTAPPEVARRMAARINNAELCLLPGTGHLLMLEQPQLFDAALLAFVGRYFAV